MKSNILIKQKIREGESQEEEVKGRSLLLFLLSGRAKGAEEGRVGSMAECNKGPAISTHTQHKLSLSTAWAALQSHWQLKFHLTHTV